MANNGNEDDIIKQNAMENLRQMLLMYAESNEKVIAKFNKILRRLSLIFSVLALIGLTGIGFIIYAVTRPASETASTLKMIDELNKTVLLQRKFNRDDREDIAKARSEYLQLRRIDSINNRKDSILKIKLLKAVK